MRYLLPLAGLLALAGCTNLPDLTASNVCGNGVIEPSNDEDCEPGRSLPDGLVCGASGEELACRFVCGDADTDDEVGVCPDGWGCAYDGYCQAPAGEFGEPQVVNGITTPLGIGDFDGDEYPDLATVQEPLLKVAFGNALAEYGVSLEAPVDSAPGDPVVADIGSDGRDDLILFAGDSLTIYEGQSDQSLAPLMVPTRIYGELPATRTMVGVPINIRPERQQAVLVTADRDAGLLRLRLADVDEDDVVERSIASPDATVVPDNIATGDLWPEPAGEAPLFELALAPYRGQAVVLYSLVCADEDGPSEGDGVTYDCQLEEAGRVPAPPGWQLSTAGTFAGDLDGDGIDDLVFGLQGPEGQAAAGALREADGFGEARVLDIPYEVVGPAPVMPGAQEMMGSPPAWLLGVADLDGGDGDDRVDVITANQIMRAAPGTEGMPLQYEPGFAPERRWSMVRVTDLNRDGLPDLAGITGPSLITHLNVGGVSFNEHETSLGDDQAHVQVGDFDGDLLPDLLVQVDNRLLLGFNNGRGLIDGLEEAVSLNGVVTPLVIKRPDDADAIDDVMLVVNTAGLPPYLLELRGSGTRRLAAPLQLPELVDAAVAIRGQTAQGLTGQRGEDGWIFRAIDQSAVLTALSVVPDAVEQVGDCGFALQANLLFGRYLAHPDDVRETLVGIETTTPTVMTPFSGPWTPRVLSFDGGNTLTCTALEPSPLTSAPSGIQVADIDGDGSPDLIVAHPAVVRPDGPQAENQDGGLAIWWGDGVGGFDPTPETVLRAGASAGQMTTGQVHFRGVFATLEADGIPGHEVLMLFGNGLQMLTFDGAFGEPVLLPRQRIEPGDVERIDTIDLDLDGVTDMVLSGPRQTVIVLQLACAPLQAAEGECFRDVYVDGEL